MLTEKCKNQESMLTKLFCCVFQVIRMLTEKCKNQESVLTEMCFVVFSGDTYVNGEV